ADRPSSELVLTEGAFSTDNDAVDEHPLIPPKVGCLSRSPQHRKPQVVFPDQRFDRADSGGAVGSYGAYEHDAGPTKPLLTEPLPAQQGKVRLLLRKANPMHRLLRTSAARRGLTDRRSSGPARHHSKSRGLDVYTVTLPRLLVTSCSFRYSQPKDFTPLHVVIPSNA